jgi:phenylacetate-CoA ligase
MDEEEFQKILPRLRENLAFALENPYSDFYRKKYKGLNIKPENINTYEDFCRIPMLTKDEILALPLSKRYFVPVEEAVRYSISSGTSSHNKPLILPHIKKVKVPGIVGSHAIEESVLKEFGIDKIFGLMPAQSVLMSMVTDSTRRIPMVIPDISKLDMAVVLACELQIEAIVSSPTTLYFFTEELKKTNFDLTKIKWISIGSEFCTSQKFKYFKKSYPKATFKIRFGSSECGASVGYRCTYRQDDPPQIFHPSDLHLIEIVPDENEENKNFGEMVFTHLTRDAFPLIRYQTNDFATLKRFDCECGQRYIIDTSGKNKFDILKTSGVILHTQAIADAIEGVSQYVKPQFQIHVYEESINNKIMTRLKLKLIPLKNNLDNKEIAQYIQSQLQVTLDKMLEDVVREGAFLPLEVEFVDFIEGNVKTKHIISHL